MEYIASSVQDAETAACVIATVALFKPLVKSYVKENLNTIVLVALSILAGMTWNFIFTFYPTEWWVQGMLIGIVGTGSFAAVKDISTKKEVTIDQNGL